MKLFSGKLDCRARSQVRNQPAHFWAARSKKTEFSNKILDSKMFDWRPNFCRNFRTSLSVPPYRIRSFVRISNKTSIRRRQKRSKKLSFSTLIRIKPSKIQTSKVRRKSSTNLFDAKSSNVIGNLSSERKRWRFVVCREVKLLLKQIVVKSNCREIKFFVETNCREQKSKSFILINTIIF